jgi:hypothetical protein
MSQTYVDFRMKEWGVKNCPQNFQACVRKILNELTVEALLCLKNPRLEVQVRPESDYSVWAYFPINQRRLIARELHPQSETRVLLVFSLGHFQRDRRKFFEDCIRDALGDVLLYLREPKARNECSDAMKEWRRSRVRRAGTSR